SVKTTWDLDKALESIPEANRDAFKEMIQKMAGTEQHTWFGTDGKLYFEVNAKDWPEAKKLVEGYLSGKSTLADEPSFQSALKHLPAEAAVAGLMDGGRYAHMMAQVLGAVFSGQPGAELKTKAPEGPPKYVAFAMTLKPGHGTIDVWVPIDAAKAIIDALK